MRFPCICSFSVARCGCLTRFVLFFSGLRVGRRILSVCLTVSGFYTFKGLAQLFFFFRFERSFAVLRPEQRGTADLFDRQEHRKKMTAQPIYFSAQPFVISCIVNLFSCAAIFERLRRKIKQTVIYFVFSNNHLFF